MVARKLTLLLALFAIALVAISLSVFTGSRFIAYPEMLRLLVQPDDSVNALIIHELRLPRTLAAFAVGGLLGLAGALMQVLLRNPLGDPYILGVSGGAAVAVLGAMLLGASTLWYTPLAFVGALISMLIVVALAHRGEWNTTRLLLTGVVLAAGWAAIISFILSLSPPVRLPGMLFWLMGDLGHAGSPVMPMAILIIGLLIAFAIAPALNIAVRGDLQATALGVNIKSLQWALYLLTSLLAAAAVSVAGAVGFIGLISPHLVRLIVGSDHRLVIPGSLLMGATILVLADTIARSAISPIQLPVGVLTALIGVPVFLFLLNKSGRSV